VRPFPLRIRPRGGRQRKRRGSVTFIWPCHSCPPQSGRGRFRPPLENCGQTWQEAGGKPCRTFFRASPPHCDWDRKSAPPVCQKKNAWSIYSKAWSIYSKAWSIYSKQPFRPSVLETRKRRCGILKKIRARPVPNSDWERRKRPRGDLPRPLHLRKKRQQRTDGARRKGGNAPPRRGKASTKRNAKEAAPTLFFLKKIGTGLRGAKKNRSFALKLCAQPRAVSVEKNTRLWRQAHVSPYQLTL